MEGELMLKRVLILGVLIYFGTLLVAGDVAVFVDEGFSQDGKTYVFAQYGSIDKVWQGFAEIYTVDIMKNDYIDEGRFKTSASSKTAGKTGLSVYEDLFEKNSTYLNKLSLQPANLEQVLYIKTDSKKALNEIVFQDFEGSTEENPMTYHITLVPWYSGKTSSSSSSFFIAVEKRDRDGNLVEKQVVGNPDIKRAGVIGYSIEKIMRSPDEKSLIFVIEKTIATASGTSIRYMIETLVVAEVAE